MLHHFFTQREVFEHDLGYCKLFKTKHNGLKSTKIYLVNDSPDKYAILLDVKHYNIIPIYRITQHSVFTKHVEPFSIIFDKNKRLYLKYVLFQLKKTIDFIHENLNIKNLNLRLSSLFVDTYGNVLIGNFIKYEKINKNLKTKNKVIADEEWDEIEHGDAADYNNYKKNKSIDIAYDEWNEIKHGYAVNCNKNIKYNSIELADEDYYSLNELSKQFLDIEFNEISEEDETFRFLEKKNDYEKLTTGEKKKYLNKLLNNKDQFIRQIKQNVCRLIITSIKKATDEEYKIFALNFLFKFKENLIELYSKEMFSILDTPIRFYLLKNAKGSEVLNDCIEELCLGLKVKLKELKIETINFIFENKNVLNKKSTEFYLEVMKNEVTDSEIMEIICKGLIDLNRNDLIKPIYELLMKFLLTSEKKEYVYLCIEEYFCMFNKQKISSELLPCLCSKLVDQDGQDQCFILVEKIIDFLKKNKNEILKRGWSIDNFKEMFIGRRGYDKNKVDKKYNEVYKIEIESEWEERENI